MFKGKKHTVQFMQMLKLVRILGNMFLKTKKMQFRRLNCPFQKFWTIVLTDNSFANIKKVV